ncbi:MAG: hypothetical protein K6A23_08440 [Butyrivibrio sp.]|nr:hypothetical protein [Butyrivibrio sp.]
MGDYRIGYVTGLLAAFAITFIAIILIRKFKGGYEHYDERQILARGKGYKISFMTVLLSNFLYAFFFYGVTKDIVSPQFIIIAIAMIGVMVYAVYCIFHDAYVQVGQNNKTWLIVLALVIISNLLGALSNREEGFSVDGLANGKYLNLLIAIVFSVVLIAFLIKSFIDKRGESHEES